MVEPVNSDARVVVASNRGPLSYTLTDDGALVARRGAGGLVSGMSTIAREGGVLWVCAALSEADRRAARAVPGGRLDANGADTGGMAVRMLDIDAATFHRAYNAVANSTLWFIHHHLYDTPNAPHFDHRFRREWESFAAYDRAFATALAEDAAPDASVIVQDYHLTLTPRMLREKRPDLRIGHFSHTPWAAPDYFRLLPDDVGRAILLGILGADHAGFLCDRWAQAFMDCCAAFTDAVVGSDSVGSYVELDGHTTRIGVHPLGVDGEELRERGSRADVESRVRLLRTSVGTRQAIVRIDRTELSKNIVRGLAAYREMLRNRHDLHDRVIHL